MILKILAKNVRYYRKKKNWPQEKLAEKANCSRNNISDIENAKYPATLIKIENIANALGVEVYKLFIPYNQK